MARPRHPNKDLERLLQEAERKKWQVAKPKKYYKIRCPCGEHQHTVHITPSDPNYERNLRGRLRRTGCWEDT
jgi:hypothetical protein